MRRQTIRAVARLAVMTLAVAFLPRTEAQREVKPLADLPSFPKCAHWVPRLVAGLAEPDPVIRARCAFLLGQIGSPPSTAGLLKSLQDADHGVRRQAGVALCQLGRTEGLEAADDALRSGPGWLRYYAGRALARLGTSAARKALERARTKQSAYLRRVIRDVLAQKPSQLAPKSPEGALVPEQWPDLFIAAGDILIVESDWYFHKGDYDQAIRANEADVFLDPQNVDAWTNAAWLTWSMNRDEEADKLYEACIAANPKEYDAYFQYGMFRNARKRLAEAAELMKRACACEGAPVTVFRMCGHTLEAAGRTAEARQWWQEAAKKFPDDPVIKRKVDETKRETRGTEGIVSDA